MLIFRWLFLLLLGAGVVSLAMYVSTGQKRFRVIGIRLVKWTVVAALAFFAVLILERLVVIL
jgi:hypothetical protein